MSNNICQRHFISLLNKTMETTGPACFLALQDALNNRSFVNSVTAETASSSSSREDSACLGAPIGYIRSCFKSKNGTPRQPSVCAFSRAKLTVLKAVFPNPEHSIQGLAEFSHIWILFVFHKNGGGKFTKAKVKPPRLDGAKVGVFATRSPHRPNPIGLTLAKLDKIEGATLHLSGVDIIDGTPVLDIKPYVPSYDNPDRIQRDRTSVEHSQSGCSLRADCPSLGDKASEDGRSDKLGLDTPSSSTEHVGATSGSEVTDSLGKNSPEVLLTGKARTQPSLAETTYAASSSEAREQENEPGQSSSWEPQLNAVPVVASGSDGDGNRIPIPAQDPSHQAAHRGSNAHPGSCASEKSTTNSERNGQEGRTDSAGAMADSAAPAGKEDEYSCRSKVEVADWIHSPPIRALNVRFTAHAEQELRNFKRGSIDPNYGLEFLNDQGEAKQAICKILQADPRSTYRRNTCQDRLYFFTVDTLHVTSWFGPDFAEVLRVQLISCADIL